MREANNIFAKMIIERPEMKDAESLFDFLLDEIK